MNPAEQAHDQLWEAVATAEPISQAAAALLIQIADNHLAQAQWQQAVDVASRALDVATHLADAQLTLSATSLRGYARFFLGEVRAARADLATASAQLDLISDRDLTPILSEALLRVARTETLFTMWPEAVAHAERGARTATVPALVAAFHLDKAAVETGRGRLLEACAAARDCLAAAHSDGRELVLVTAYAITSWAFAFRGDFETSLPAGAHAVELAGRVPAADLSWMARGFYAEALLLAGRPKQAWEQLVADDPQQGTIPPGVRARWHRLFVEASVAIGQPGEASHASHRIGHLAATTQINYVQADAAYAEACLHLAQADPVKAAESALRAADFSARDGLILDEGRALVLAGHALQQTGDLVASRDAVAQATQIFDECGARDLAAQARLNTPSPAAAAKLTPRELEIARLVAAGQSNRQAARRLGLSEKTIEAHLSRVFAKLDISSRSVLRAALHSAALTS